MARNLPIAFAAIIGGGVLLDAAIKGAPISDVIKGQAHASSSSSGSSPSLAPTSGGAVNPFAKAKQVTVGRTDMGVDFNLAPGDPILAPFAGTVTAINQGWYNGQPQVVLAGAPGTPFAGRFMYVAEGIAPSVNVGDTLAAGDPIGVFQQYGNGGEMGWAANASGQTEAQAQGHGGGGPTTAGDSWRAFLASLGVHV